MKSDSYEAIAVNLHRMMTGQLDLSHARDVTVVVLLSQFEITDNHNNDENTASKFICIK